MNMRLKDMQAEELELLSYTDMTYLLIKENKKSMNTPSLFRQISDLLGFSEEEYNSKIGDYYTSLNIDKRFVLLDNHEWDIRDHHSTEMLIDDEDSEEEEEETIEEEPEEEEEDNIDEIIDDDDLEEDDTIDLSIIEEDEELED